jgi:hypothetical protein
MKPIQTERLNFWSSEGETLGAFSMGISIDLVRRSGEAKAQAVKKIFSAWPSGNKSAYAAHGGHIR